VTEDSVDADGKGHNGWYKGNDKFGTHQRRSRPW